jgi:succinyl-CoA synthetase beta subunit
LKDETVKRSHWILIPLKHNSTLNSILIENGSLHQNEMYLSITADRKRLMNNVVGVDASDKTDRETHCPTNVSGLERKQKQNKNIYAKRPSHQK